MKFKKGDRVRIDNPTFTRYHGKTGVINRVNKNKTWIIVNMDNDGSESSWYAESLEYLGPQPPAAPQAKNMQPRGQALKIPKSPMPTTRPWCDAATAAYLGVDADGVHREPGQDEDGTINGRFL